MLGGTTEKLRPRQTTISHAITLHFLDIGLTTSWLRWNPLGHSSPSTSRAASPISNAACGRARRVISAILKAVHGNRSRPDAFREQTVLAMLPVRALRFFRLGHS